MFSVNNNNISLIRGDSGVFELAVQDTDGNAVELDAEDVLTFTVRRVAASPIVVIRKQIDIADMQINLEPADTEGLRFSAYVYDVELKRSDGFVDTIIPPHSFEILEEVTY